MLATVYALYAVKIGATPLQIGISLGLYNLAAGLLVIVIGRFEDGSKRQGTMVVTGYAITILAVILFLFVTKPTQLYFVQIINAVGLGLYMPAWKSIYSRNELHGHEASQWGVFDGGNMIIMALAALTAGYLVNVGAYRSLFLVIAAFYTVAPWPRGEYGAMLASLIEHGRTPFGSVGLE